MSDTLRWSGPFIGRRTLLPEGHFSGIVKRAVTGSLQLDQSGFAEDVQVDQRVHGGAERAVCVLTETAYRHWAEVYPRRAADFVPGAFGENLCWAGIDEREACIGDRWQLGEAVLEISQPRNPCWKLSQHMELPDLSKRIVKTGYGAGWLCRVIQPGYVQAGDPLRRVHCHPARLSITDLWELTLHDSPDRTNLAAAAELEVLAPTWRERLRARARLLFPPMQER